MEDKILNVYGRMSLARKIFTEERVKKNKTNAFAKYNYYDLNAIYPTLNRILEQVGLFSHIQINEQIAILSIINVDNPNEEILFTMPAIKAELAKSTQIQEWGSTISYLSRYLLITAFQIGEEDDDNGVDSTTQSELRNGKPKPTSKKGNDNLSMLLSEADELKENLKKQKKLPAANQVIIKLCGKPTFADVTDEEILKKVIEELKKI